MRNTQQIRNDAGYAMAALLVAMALMALFMTIAMPVWKQASQREKEEELVWRGQQYDRAIQLFRRKTSAPGAPNLNMLVEQRFLRRQYKDPITGKDFALKPVALGGVNMPPGVPQPPGTQPPGTQPPGTQPPGTPPQQQPGMSQSPGGLQPPGSQQVPGGNGQLIGGVRSTSKAKSIRVLNGRDHYDQWEFVYTPYGTKSTAAGPAAQPGMMPGQNPGGSPTGSGSGSRPGTTPSPSPTPAPSQPPPPAPEPTPEPPDPG